MTTPHYGDQFRLSITEALGTQLHAALDRLDPAPLTQENLDALRPLAKRLALPSMAGVYQLFRQQPGGERELTYIGKADKPLPDRLEKHLFKLSGRRGISLDEISFKCLFVEEDLSSVSPEKMLIKREKQTGSITWNNRGFGPNDPGRERDTTRVRINHFDLEFPINLDREVTGLTLGTHDLASVLLTVKNRLPFNFRYQKAASLKEIPITITEERMSADAVFRLIAAHMPNDWQISALVGWAIMYKDFKNNTYKLYPSTFRYYRHDEVLDAEPQIRKARKNEEDEYEDDEEDEG